MSKNFRFGYGSSQITFGNMVLSMGNRPTHYCDNRNGRPDFSDTCSKYDMSESNEVEVAILMVGDELVWRTREVFAAAGFGNIGDDVYGYCTPEELQKVIAVLIVAANANGGLATDDSQAKINQSVSPS